MFLSMYMLKTFLSVGIVTTLLLGIISLFVLLYAYLTSIITAQFLTDIRDGFIIAFITTSIMMIISSLGGIYGLIHKTNKLIIAYSLAMTLYFIVVIVILIFLIYLPSYL
jgi:hypothetical protein